MTEQNQTPAGWFPQPDGRQRYWDGSTWTEHYAPGPPPQGQAATTGPAKKKRRIFLWVFLAVQVLFIIGIIAAVAGSGDATDCGTLSQQVCNDAKDLGTGIGVFLIVVVWIVVDFLMGLIYGIYRLAKRT